jgi:hypothetical protein
MGALSAFPDASTSDRRTAVAGDDWTCGARSDLRLAWDRSAVRFGYRFRGRGVARTDNQEVVCEVGNEPWPEAADSNMLHIGRCGEGCELQPAKMIRR